MRPYIYQIRFSGILGTPIISDNVWLFPANIFTLFDYVCVFKPAFYVWNKGAFLLSALLDEYYYQPAGGGAHNPVDFSWTFEKPTSPLGASLLNIPFGVSTTPNAFTLPSVNQDYWWSGSET